MSSRLQDVDRRRLREEIDRRRRLELDQALVIRALELARLGEEIRQEGGVAAAFPGSASKAIR